MKKPIIKGSTELVGPLNGNGLKNVIRGNKATAENISISTSFSEEEMEIKTHQAWYQVKKLELDGFHLRVLKELKHENCRTAGKGLCSCHYEEVLCLMKSSSASISPFYKNNLRGLSELQNRQHDFPPWKNLQWRVTSPALVRSHRWINCAANMAPTNKCCLTNATCTYESVSKNTDKRDPIVTVYPAFQKASPKAIKETTLP